MSNAYISRTGSEDDAFIEDFLDEIEVLVARDLLGIAVERIMAYHGACPEWGSEPTFVIACGDSDRAEKFVQLARCSGYSIIVV